ncbi:hypothetical protein SAMN05216420_10994 [Nitrosospira sp. Nl5]|nr:hypothetical protein SAMN05216420_10994 [Nitrosospira sp. Nl5]
MALPGPAGWDAAQVNIRGLSTTEQWNEIHDVEDFITSKRSARDLHATLPPTTDLWR